MNELTTVGVGVIIRALWSIAATDVQGQQYVYAGQNISIAQHTLEMIILILLFELHFKEKSAHLFMSWRI